MVRQNKSPETTCNSELVLDELRTEVESELVGDVSSDKRPSLLFSESFDCMIILFLFCSMVLSRLTLTDVKVPI